MMQICEWVLILILIYLILLLISTIILLLVYYRPTITVLYLWIVYVNGLSLVLATYLGTPDSTWPICFIFVTCIYSIYCQLNIAELDLMESWYSMLR